ncbi:hypothetical protein PAPYR_10744 [Paratrimastix pyriformis]|uniref:Secreted protein n=1 Tax=Paratrimastix pyriformis TaxID=342808 RepID=A0ABQ8U7X6_9EUKA|nr:hypothetical protein PAPYR_10744 [Paratrimastix pyriformis]
MLFLAGWATSKGGMGLTMTGLPRSPPPDRAQPVQATRIGHACLRRQVHSRKLPREQRSPRPLTYITSEII